MVLVLHPDTRDPNQMAEAARFSGTIASFRKNSRGFTSLQRSCSYVYLMGLKPFKRARTSIAAVAS